MTPASTLVKSRIAGGVFATTVLLIVVLANLPYRYVEREGIWYGHQSRVGPGIRVNRGLQPTMAGWPMRYWIRYESDERFGGADRFWSTPRLVINVMVGLVAAGLVYGFTQLRRQAIESAKNQQRMRAIFDVVIALGIVLLPPTWYLLNYQSMKSQYQLVRGLVQRGSVYLSCELPEPIAARVPSGLVSAMMRIRLVQLRQPGDQLLEEAARIPTLRGISLSGDQYDTASIKPLRSLVHLSSVSINRRKLSDDDVQAIARCRYLQRLNLAQTNLDGRLLRAFDDVHRLRSVNLARTPLKLSELGKPAWSDNVQTLSLPRPRQGQGATLTVDGWPELKRLVVSRWSLKLNPSTLELRLSNLPKLESLLIDRVQRHALIGHNLPRLSTIDEHHDSMMFSLGYGDSGIPGFTWFSEVQLHGVASLTHLHCHANDLRSISIQNAPNLRVLELGTFSIFGDGMARIQSSSVDSLQACIDSLGQSDGPRILELNALPLHQVDLSPLAKNPRLQELGMSHTKVSCEQLRGLSGLTNLTRLDIAGCRLQDEQLLWIFNAYPNLKKLTADVSDVQNFDLSAAPNLDVVDVTPFGDIRRFRLVDRPRLKSYFRLDRAPERLEVRNVPSLMGIEVHRPWPQDSTITGLRDLQTFVAGGPEIDDRVVDSLLLCRSLDQLTLAYPSVSPQKLGEIGQLMGLTSIELPGAKVDDMVTQHWKQLSLLNNVNLDDTSVSTETFLWLSSIDVLRALSINRVELDEKACRALGLLVQLAELQLVNTAVPNETLERILAASLLQRLNLSGNTIDAELVGALAQCMSLRQLTLRDCNVSDKHVEQLLASNPDLLLDLGDDIENLDPKVAEMIDARRQAGPHFQRGSWENAAEHNPSFKASLIGSNFMLIGTMPMTEQKSLDLSVFRATN